MRAPEPNQAEVDANRAELAVVLEVEPEEVEDRVWESYAQWDDDEAEWPEEYGTFVSYLLA